MNQKLLLLVLKYFCLSMAEMLLKASRMLSALLFASSLLPWVHGEPQVPCYFIFGDSLFDNGNNNLLLNLAKVNYLPYGIDFPKGPTGRFSNGRNIGDAIGTVLLPFLNSIVIYQKIINVCVVVLSSVLASPETIMLASSLLFCYS